MSAFRAHQLPHLEAVDDLAYERVVTTTLGIGWFRVDHDNERTSVRLSLWNGSGEDLEAIAISARRMFDLDADPIAIGQVMRSDPYLSSVWERHPGLRVFRSWSGFESILATVLGQLVSVTFGRTLTGELMQAAGAKAPHPKTGESIHLFPTAERILSADLASIRTSPARRVAIRALAKLVVEGTLNWEQPIPSKELRKILLSVPGVGVWTAEYAAMRAFHDNDAFPGTDYGLKQELKRHPDVDVNRVRPWRAYAATALWKSFAEAKGMVDKSVV